MGVVMSMVSRRINRFNVENRAHRVLDRDKPIAAPKFESNIKDMQRALELDPNLVEKLSKKDSLLDKNLKNVYVTSEQNFIDYGVMRSQNPDKPLPLNRTAPDYMEYGYLDPKQVSRGRCTLKQAMEFITNHNSEPEVWTKQRIVETYKMKENVINDILQHFRTFNLYVPEQSKWNKRLEPTQTKQIAEKEPQSST